jgi:Kef-type K+ transport system membrane component KefB
VKMFELLSVGIIILLGVSAGKISHRFKIPKITGYMLSGLIFGPSILGIISESTLKDIYVINEIALGLILFAIGGEIELHHIKAMGKKVIFLAIGESMGAFVLVSLTAFFASGDLGLAVILGSISMATAPGVTLLVIREYQTRGPLTDTLLAVVAINNVLCLVIFQVFFALYSALQGDPILVLLIAFFKEIIGSVIIGAAIGGLITLWEQKIDDLSELLLVIIGGLLVGIGVAKTMGFSPLLISLIIGAVTNNLSMMHRLVYAELRQTETPFFIAFFVLSGASLDLISLKSLGLLGFLYLFSRPAGKYLGSYIAGAKYGLERQVRQNIGMALIPQAGVAIGLILTVSETHPELGKPITSIILSSIIIYEALGPFLTKLALGRTKEIYLEE